MPPQASSLAAVEPDDDWKAQLRRRINHNIQPMLQDAKDSLAANIQQHPDDEQALIDQFNAHTVPNIHRMADETFQAELVRERRERMWALQVGQTKPSPEYVKQQEEAMAKLKSTSTAAAAAAMSPTTTSTMTIPSSTSSSNTIPSSTPSSTPSPTPSSTSSSITTSSSTTTIPSTSTSTHRPRPQASEFLNSTYVIPKLPKELEARLLKSRDFDSPLPRSTSVHMSPNTSPTKSSTLDRSRTTTDRPVATSPASTKSVHEIWKPQVFQDEDLPSTSNVGRKNSNASMRSTTSTSSALRTPETIPERVHDPSKTKRSAFSAASAAAAAARPPLSSSPASPAIRPPLSSSPAASSAAYFKMPPLDETAFYGTPLHSHDHDERYPTLSPRNRDLDHDDRASDPLDFAAGPDYDPPPQVRQYHERQSLSRLTSVSRLRDDHIGKSLSHEPSIPMLNPHKLIIATTSIPLLPVSPFLSPAVHQTQIPTIPVLPVSVGETGHPIHQRIQIGKIDLHIHFELGPLIRI